MIYLQSFLVNEKLINMPITKSAKKALRQSKKHEIQNKSVIRSYKEAVKHTRQENTPENLRLAQSKLDIAAKKNIISKNKARRLKSRLSKPGSSTTLK